MIDFFKELLTVKRFFDASRKFNDLTFYSENSIYFQFYKGTIDYIINNSNIKILYITSDKNDPVFEYDNDRINVFYIKRFIPLVFPLIGTKALVLTMADLNRYHIKKSTKNVNHIYMFHSAVSSHVQYNQGAFNHYDTIFCVGPHHVNEIRKTEEIYKLNKKNLVKVGYSWLEELDILYKEKIKKTKTADKILIAPSWGKGNILDSCINQILDNILHLKLKIIVRPHPEYIKRNFDKLVSLKSKYKNFKNLIFELKSDSFENIIDSSLLITDWSGIAIEFELGMGKPVIYINTPKKIHNDQHGLLKIQSIEDELRIISGLTLEIDDCSRIDEFIQKEIQYKKSINRELKNFRDKYIFNWGSSSKAAAKYIIDFCKKS